MRMGKLPKREAHGADRALTCSGMREIDGKDAAIRDKRGEREFFGLLSEHPGTCVMAKRRSGAQRWG